MISLHLQTFPSKCFMANWCWAVTILASACNSFAIAGLLQKKTPTDSPYSLLQWALVMAFTKILFQLGRPA